MRRSEERLTLDVNVRVEAREGHWAATMEQFPITVYGDSQLAAEGRVLEALKLLLSRHANSAETLSKYLTLRNVSHVVETAPIAGAKPRPYAVARSHRVTVPVGV